MPLSVREKVIFEEIARNLSKGLDPGQIAIETSLDKDFIQKCIAHPEFDKIFALIDPEAYESWKEAQMDLVSKMRVKAKARADAPDHYQRLKALVDAGEDMRPLDQANLYLALIKMSGVIDKDEVHEIVTFSPAQLETLKEALAETS